MAHRPFVRWLVPGAALAAAVVLVAPASLRAYTLAGWSLGIDQRTVAVYDNFTDVEANDNTAEASNFPGYTGIELAIWKAVVEWGSELFGDGTGDVTQPGDLGSGGANFDAFFVGNATAIGGMHDNTVSEIAGSSGGLLGVTEYGPSGWRIRLYSAWTWDDDPVAPATGAIDVQGLITHEYGHALGLGHSSVAGSTMYAATSGDGTAARSIEADDQAGVQAIYGVKSATKPHIDSLSGDATLTIHGANFDASSNEVWFTPWPWTTAGDAIQVTGVASTAGGTQIDVAVPLEAGPGNVLVRVPGSSGDKLSNAYPFASPWSPEVYCVAKVNSQGCTPEIGWSGVASATSGAEGVVGATSVLNQKFGLLFYGIHGAAAIPFGGGTLCVKLPLERTAVQSSGGNPPPADCSGSYSFDLHAHLASGVDPTLTPGTAMWMQFWSRDPGFAPPNNVGLTDALTLTVVP